MDRFRPRLWATTLSVWWIPSASGRGRERDRTGIRPQMKPRGNNPVPARTRLGRGTRQRGDVTAAMVPAQRQLPDGRQTGTEVVRAGAPDSRAAGRVYDGHVIGTFQLMNGVLAGAILIVFGAVPGLFQQLVDGLQDGIQDFASRMSSQFPGPPCQHEQLPQPRWLAGLGAALIAATVLAYLSS